MPRFSWALLWLQRRLDRLMAALLAPCPFAPAAEASQGPPECQIRSLQVLNLHTDNRRHVCTVHSLVATGMPCVPGETDQYAMISYS